MLNKLMHCFQLVFQLTFQLVSKPTRYFFWYLKILLIYKWYQLLFCQLQFDFTGIKICFVDLKNFKICFKVISKFVDIYARGA